MTSKPISRDFTPKIMPAPKTSSRTSKMTEDTLTHMFKININSINSGETRKIKETTIQERLDHSYHLYNTQLATNYRMATAALVIGALVLGIGFVVGTACTGGIGCLAAGTLLLAYGLGKASYTSFDDYRNQLGTTQHRHVPVFKYDPRQTPVIDHSTDDILKLFSQKKTNETAVVLLKPPVLLSTKQSEPQTRVVLKPTTGYDLYARVSTDPKLALLPATLPLYTKQPREIEQRLEIL